MLACNSTLFITGCVAVVHLIDIPTQGILTPTTAKPAFPPITLQADDNDPTLHYFSGQINPFTPQRFKDYLDRNTQLGTLVLESTGGHVYAAREIARLIQQADINTRVDSYCYSSCTLIFASGTKRTAGTRAELGFHGYQYRTGSSAIYDNIESQQHKDTLIFLKQGISQTFIDHIFSAPHNQLWLPDNDETYRLGPVDAFGNAADVLKRDGIHTVIPRRDVIDRQVNQLHPYEDVRNRPITTEPQRIGPSDVRLGSLQFFFAQTIRSGLGPFVADDINCFGNPIIR